MNKKLTLQVGLPVTEGGNPLTDTRCARSNMVICPGYGDENFNFPSVEEAVHRSLKRLDKQSQSRGKKGQAIKASTTGVPIPVDPAGIKRIIPQLPESRQSGVDATLFAAAEGLRLHMDDGRFDAIVAERFDDHSDKVQWAREILCELQPKFLPAVVSLESQLTQLRALYLETLPRVLQVLAAQNPEISEHTLLDAAIDTLDQELIQILSVLRIWTDAFGQLRSGNYKQLEAVVFAVEQAFNLFEGADPETAHGEDDGRLTTTRFHIGNVFVARFSDQGPATLPGTRGPIGAHAIEVPHDEQNIISLMLVLYMHEFRHDIFADVDGLAPELMQVVAQSIHDAVERGEVSFSKEKVRVGRNSVLMRDLLMKLFTDTIGEVDADISGGVLLCGPAYLYNMLSTFSAFNAKDGVFNTDRLLRTGSYFGYRDLPTGQRTLQFWPHPPDYIRAYIVAAALDEIGFPEEARQCRLLADQAVGNPLPDEIVWRNEERKSKTKIKIPVADIKAIAPVVARALIRSELKSLGGVSAAQVINWTPHRQAKVDRLVETLMSGRSELPDDMGTIYATYVAAAATLAYWGLVKSGYPARKAATVVDTNALQMIEAIRVRFAEGCQHGAADCPSSEQD